MEFEVVKGVDREGFAFEWMKLKRLGEGSYGVVDMAIPMSVSDHRVFAVKSCLLEDSASVQKELYILKRFTGCGNIVQCYGEMMNLNQDGNLVYNLFLEYAPGGTLLDLMIKKYGGNIPESDAKSYTKMLLEGLRDIHEKGYVHCDLKPASILVFYNDINGSSIATARLKIADFGLVRVAGERKYKVGVLDFPGTPLYMSPESFTKISSALDIWSLGCIVLQMITGKSPWKFQNLDDLAMKIANDPPRIADNISSFGKDFLMKCFARNPDDRWSADMLLSHPFLLPDNIFEWSPPLQTKSLHHAQSQADDDDHLPIAIQLTVSEFICA